ncbi:MAG: Pseudogene of transpisase [Methanobrevibacter sp. CfCl-M3]
MFYKHDKNELSGVIAIDEQFPMVNGEKKAKSVVMDLGTKYLIYSRRNNSCRRLKYRYSKIK